MSDFQRGDHIREFEGFYWHHAIFVEWTNRASIEARLIHHRGKNDGGQIKDEKNQDVSHYELVFRPSDPEVVLARANSRVGRGGYNLWFQNCEHFANWCCTGVETSAQIVGHNAGTIPRVLAQVGNAVTAALNPGNVDATPLEAIRGVAGQAFCGSVAVAELASVARASYTAQGLEHLVRWSNQLSVWGVASRMVMPTGLGNPLRGYDLAATLGSGEEVLLHLGRPGSSTAEVTVPSRSTWPQDVSGSEQAFRAASVLRSTTLALEVGGHIYNICNAPDARLQVIVIGGRCRFNVQRQFRLNGFCYWDLYRFLLGVFFGIVEVF